MDIDLFANIFCKGFNEHERKWICWRILLKVKKSQNLEVLHNIFYITCRLPHNHSLHNILCELWKCLTWRRHYSNNENYQRYDCRSGNSNRCSNVYHVLQSIHIFQRELLKEKIAAIRKRVDWKYWE